MGVPVSAHLNGVRATRAWGLEESFNQLSLLPRERKVSLLQQVLQLCNLNTTKQHHQHPSAAAAEAQVSPSAERSSSER
jgi:hypothetical protein